MKVHVRFAPSPTGLLHLGNARTALVNWLFARAKGGQFMLRLDDTDVGRSTADFAAAIERDLKWLGLDWDGFARQSDRLARYDEAIAKLKKKGRLYACYETPEELETKRKLLQARRLPPIYDRASLMLSQNEKERLITAGRTPHWRFLLNRRRIDWQDAVRGPTHIDTTSLSDPVLVRADGVPLYTLASVVDDIDFGITHIVRGEDHVTNTAPQIELFEALGGQVPVFAHLALLIGADGEGLSKRLGSLSLETLRGEGLEPLAIDSLLARLGTSQPVEAKTSLADLAAGFDFSHFGRAPARYDPAELAALSARVIHQLPYSAVADRLPADADEAFWLAIRANLAKVADAADWLKIVRGPVVPAVAEPEFLAAAAAALPAAFDGATWAAWTSALKASTGRKGKALFQPLRLALTGLEHGPEMAVLLPLIGPERVRERLAGRAA